MEKNNWIRKIMLLVAMGIVIIGIYIWWRAPILYGEWNKQTIYVGLIDTWYGKSKDSELPNLKVGDTATALKITARQSFTNPPARYTEGSLVKKLEELGLALRVNND